MLNSVALVGRLVVDPELRHTQNDIAVSSFRVAVDRDFFGKLRGAPGGFYQHCGMEGYC